MPLQIFRYPGKRLELPMEYLNSPVFNSECRCIVIIAYFI
jgi:hypothetical protein